MLHKLRNSLIALLALCASATAGDYTSIGIDINKTGLNTFYLSSPEFFGSGSYGVTVEVYRIRWKRDPVTSFPKPEILSTPLPCFAGGATSITVQVASYTPSLPFTLSTTYFGQYSQADSQYLIFAHHITTVNGIDYLGSGAYTFNLP